MKTRLPAVVLTSLLWTVSVAEEPVPYPRGFRGWAHVKTAMITPAHPAFQSEGGMHHIYANEKAVEGYKTNRFPDGSVIVYELLETHDKDGVVSEGAVRRVDVMAKDETRFATSGGWRFERFAGSNQTTTVLADSDRMKCFQCHSRAADHGFVFSRIR